MNDAGPIFLPKGFQFCAITAGIKDSGRPDLALILADAGTAAAALFTRNVVVAAPVEVGRTALRESRGRARAVLVNSGNANCATGKRGIADCRKICAEAAKLLKVRAAEVFPSSTGIIGVPLPEGKIRAKLKPLLARAAETVEGLREFASAILTTDSRPKLASAPVHAGTAAITGVAKGSGMIHPQLATMLVYLLTDVKASPAELRAALRKACDQSFNTISVDGDTSTNDTVLLLASGRSGVRLRDVRRQFEAALTEVCRSLAQQIVADGEGVQHVVRLRIARAKDRSEALQVARTIAHSLLVKTAWAGADPNWGRILAAVGRSGVRLDPRKISVSIGDQVVCRAATACRFDAQAAREELSRPQSRVGVQLGRGKTDLEFLTTDLTEEYVRVNAEYST
ncbi:MAG TPA: bifunctional glutamate N-acetyltransferase/amino-acid acetyltransferase ArgJ [Terriglobales bacterium]|nr:bifunctional glutamate N-acetyltransferase/amino-acid acetyltransferase ArgJ [Terriglobales bacterium]